MNRVVWAWSSPFGIRAHCATPQASGVCGWNISTVRYRAFLGESPSTSYCRLWHTLRNTGRYPRRVGTGQERPSQSPVARWLCRPHRLSTTAYDPLLRSYISRFTSAEDESGDHSSQISLENASRNASISRRALRNCASSATDTQRYHRKCDL